jgi:hypothetical protein
VGVRRRAAAVNRRRWKINPVAACALGGVLGSFLGGFVGYHAGYTGDGMGIVPALIGLVLGAIIGGPVGAICGTAYAVVRSAPGSATPDGFRDRTPMPEQPAKPPDGTAGGE